MRPANRPQNGLFLASLVGVAVIFACGFISTVTAQLENAESTLPDEMMTIHKVGRRRIPVRVRINHEEETIWSVPVSTRDDHHELETLYDFKSGIAVYRAEGENICYVEQLVDLSFDQLLKAIKEQSLHEVFVRQAPRTLFIVNATTEPTDVRLNAICQGREIHMLISDPEQETPQESTETAKVRSKRSANPWQPTSSSAWAKATLDSAESRTNGNGYAQAYSNLGESQDSFNGYSPSKNQRRLEATSASGTFARRPDTRALESGNDGQLQQGRQMSQFSFQQSYQSPEKGHTMSSFSSPMAMVGSPMERSGLSNSFSSSSSSFAQSSLMGAADLQGMMMPVGRPMPQGNSKGPGRGPVAWTGSIPRDATVTQEAGSSQNTYTWKVQDANGYSTTHWYTGPLGSDRVPIRMQLPSELDVAGPSPSILGGGRRPVSSWTGAIPRDATVTQTAGSSQKTYTWKVTDASGYTTTHWYSGPLGPDRVPIQLGFDSDITANIPQHPQPQLQQPAHRRVAESRTVQQQQQQQSVIQQQQQQQSIIQQQQQQQRISQPQNPRRVVYQQPQQPQQLQPQQPQQPDFQHMVGQVERQQVQQQVQQVQQQNRQQQLSTSESSTRVSQKQEQQRRVVIEEQRRVAIELEQQRRAAAVEEQERQAASARQEEERQQELARQREQEIEEERRRLALEEQQRRAALEEQQRRAALEEQQRRAAVEEQQRRAAAEEKQRREDQQRRAAMEEQERKQQLIRQREQQLQQQQQQRMEQQRIEQQRRAELEEYERQQVKRQQVKRQQEEEQRVAMQEYERQQELYHQQKQSHHMASHQSINKEQVVHQEQVAPGDGHMMEESTMLKIMEEQQQEKSHQSAAEEEHHRREQHWTVGNRNGNGGRHSVATQQHQQSQQQSSSHGSSTSVNNQREFSRRSHRDSTQSFVDRGTNGNGPNGQLTNGHPTNGHPTNDHPTNGHPTNGHSTNGHSTNGHSTNGHSTNGHLTNGQSTNGHSTNGNGRNGRLDMVATSATSQQTGDHGPCDTCKQLNQLEGDIKDLFGRPSLRPSGRADIPIEHDNEPEAHQPELGGETELGMEGPEMELQPGPVSPYQPGGQPELYVPEPYHPEPEQEHYMPEPEPLPETEPGYLPEPTDLGTPGGEPVEYEETDQVICEEDEQQGQPGDQDYGMGGGGCGGPSMTATSSIFEHQVSMISVPIPAMIDHVASSNSRSGTFMSSHQPSSQPDQPLPARQQPQPGPAQQPQPKLVSGSKHVTSSSYSKTYISSGFVPIGSQPAHVQQQPAIMMPSLSSPSMSSSSSSSMSSTSMSSMSSSNKGSSSTVCQSSGFTKKCQIVYGPVKRTKICEMVPIESTGNCCSIC